MEELINKIRQYSIELDVVGDQLKLSVPEDFDSTEIIEEIKENKQELISFIKEVKSIAAFKTINPCEPKDHYVLSSAQKRLYFLQQFDLNSVTYNIPQFMKLKGSLDLEQLRVAFQGLVDRHESFRTRFVMLDEEPVQVVEEHLRFELEVFEANEEEASDIIRAFERPFDLTRAPLLRAGVVKLSENRHIVMIDVHHIISDGVSLGILTREFLSLYLGESLPDLRLQYKDYSEWQQGDESRQSLIQARDFWLGQYQELPEILSLPTDYARPAVRDFAGGKVRLTLSRSETTGLKQLAQKEGTTMFMLVLSMFNVLLSRLSNQQDLVVGTPTAGRFHDDLGGIVGMFVNTLPLRNYPTGEKTFTSFLQEVKASTLACFDHQTYQYEELINDLQVNRDTTRNPLFDVMYTYLEVEDSEEVEVAGLQSEPFKSEGTQTVKFDLSLSAEDNGNELSVSLSYTTDLFDRSTIERFLGYFQRIATAIVSDHQIRLADIDILGELERKELLFDLNQTDAIYPENLNLVALFESQAERVPQQTALVFHDQLLTYEQLNKKANQLAHYLLGQDMPPETVIGIMLERSPSLLITILGILKAGYAYVPLDPDQPEARKRQILTDCNALLLITEGPDAEAFNNDFRYLDINDEKISKTSVSNPTLAVSPDVLAYVLYTSGSTGKPKGVMIRHRSVVNLIYSQKATFGLAEDERILQFSTIIFDASVEQIWLAWLTGNTLVLVDKDTIADGHSFNQYLIDKNVTHLHATPSFLEGVDLKGANSLKRVVAGGEICSPGLVNKYCHHYDFYNEYGPTEATVTATIYQAGEKTLSDKVPIGKPLNNTKAYVLGADGELVPRGTIGELYLSGDALSLGYLNDNTLTQERFVANPFVKGTLMYKTGDLVHWLPDDSLSYMGRTDDQVKIRGYRIELGEIEACLVAHKQIREVSVVAKGKGSDQYLVAYYLSDHQLDRFDLKSHLDQALPAYMVPAHFVFLEAFPLTASGKLNRKALPDPVLGTGETYGAPANETEEQLVAIWSEVLKLEPEEISTTANFFELGGHSLRATVAVNKIRKALEVEVSLRDFFKYSDIRSLATFILTQDQLGSTTIPKAEEKDHYALSSAQKRQYFLQEFDLASVTYNMPQVIKLKGSLDLDQLQAAFQSLINRHESFRTRFVMLDEEPVQVIEEELTFELVIHKAKNEEDASRIAQNFVRPFDLTQAPLLRAEVVNISGGDYILMTDMHHIISDGVSMEILFNEFTALYRGFP
ncbi:MAG: hypothetical protein Roseis3KO_05210 [Roseivirga sp.]